MSEVDDLLRIGPVAVLSALALWLVVATRRTSARIEGHAYGFGATSRQRLAQILFRGSIVVALAVTVAHAAGIDNLATRRFDLPLALRWLGLALTVAGAGLTVFAQSGMGRGWRVGIPAQAPDDLVTGGLFALSRNPVFLGMLTTGAGLALATLSPIVLLCLAAFWIACEIQVRDEERFLESAFGERYARYRSKVGRWI